MDESTAVAGVFRHDPLGAAGENERVAVSQEGVLAAKLQPLFAFPDI